VGVVEDRASKRARTRAGVERTALELFRSRGYDAVTVEQIAAAAGVGPATFYRYFATKDGVLFAYQATWLRAVHDAARHIDPGRSRSEQLRVLLADVAAYFETQAEDMQLRDEIVAASPHLLPRTLAVQRAWEAELARGLAERRDSPADDLAARMDAALALAVLRAAFRHWRAGHAASLCEAVAATREVAAGALEPGRPVTPPTVV
jgi:AcrR family transcriptional regulator